MIRNERFSQQDYENAMAIIEATGEKIQEMLKDVKSEDPLRETLSSNRYNTCFVPNLPILNIKAAIGKNKHIVYLGANRHGWKLCEYDDDDKTLLNVRNIKDDEKLYKEDFVKLADMIAGSWKTIKDEITRFVSDYDNYNKAISENLKSFKL
jgi:hypothetical protein